MLDEIGDRNVVRVMKVAALRPDPHARTIHRIVQDELGGKGQALLPSLFAADTLRALSGRKPIYVDQALRLTRQQYIDAGFNLRTNVGADFTYNQLSGTSVAVADTLALSNNTLAAAVGDTSATLPWSTAQAANAAASGTTGEWTALGLARKAATTNTHTASATTYTLAATWTGATGASTGTSKIGLFGGAGKASQTNGATNILCLVNTFTATDLQVGDQLTVTWTITI
jgi:hypothetical protein